MRSSGSSDQRVYFARAGKQVKIGISTNPQKRLQQMRTGNPDITLLGDIPGGRRIETDLHQRFSEARLEGEWFCFTAEIARTIKGLLGKRNKQQARWARYIRSRKNAAAAQPQIAAEAGWLYIEQCLVPLGPFNQNKFYKLIECGALKTKNLQIGAARTLISVASFNAYLDQLALEAAEAEAQAVARAEQKADAPRLVRVQSLPTH